MKKFLAILLSVLMIASAVPFAFVSAAEGTPKNANVVFVAEGAADGGDGTAAKPFQTIQAGFNYLAKTGGVVVVMGVCSFFGFGEEIMPETEKHITVTSYYDGVDYRAKPYGEDPVGARIEFFIGPTTSFALHGDVTFDYINFACGSAAKNVIITANFNDLTITENCEVLFEESDGTEWYAGTFYLEDGARAYAPIILTGENVQPGGKTVVLDQTVTVNGGTWNSVRIGGRDNVSRNTYDGTVTVNIGGGRYVQYTGSHKTNNLAFMGPSQVSTTKTFVANVNITGGTFDGQLCGFGWAGGVSPEPQLHEGTVNMSITGGKFNRSYSGADGVGNIIYMAQLPNGHTTSKGYITEYGETAVVNLFIDTANMTWGDNEGLIVYTEEGPKVNLTAASDKNIIAEGVELKIKAADTTAAPTTEAPTTQPTVDTTAAPTTEPTVDTTVAPTQPEDTPATGDASVMVVFAAAAVLAVAAVVVLKKKEN